MGFDVSSWEQIASLDEGDLSEIAYPELLNALSRSGSTLLLEMVREPIEKKISVVNGVPVSCRSNLAHETFSRFMLASGRISELEFQTALSASLAREQPFGEILLERGLFTPEEIFMGLKQNLARKLLDCFTWETGKFRLRRGELAILDTNIRINVPQLVLTGVFKLVPIGQVNQKIQPLLSTRFKKNPRPRDAVVDLPLNDAARVVLSAFEAGSLSLDELARASSLSESELGRVIYALNLLELIVPESYQSAVEEPTALEPAEGGPDRLERSIPTEDELLSLKSKVLLEYLTYRRKDAFELLGVEDDASRAAVDTAYLDYAETYAPWVLSELGESDFAEQAQSLFFSGALAYSELTDDQRRQLLEARRRRKLEDKRKRQTMDISIKTDLLDPEVQFRKGLKSFETGDLRKAAEAYQFATDCDPQNPRYRTELAYCQYLTAPSAYFERSVAGLQEVVRIDARFGLALYYLGLIHQSEGDSLSARDYLEQSIKLMSPDRRPIDALRELRVSKKTKK